MTLVGTVADSLRVFEKVPQVCKEGTTLLPDADVHSPCRFAPVTGTPNWTGSYNGSPVTMTNP